MDGVDYVWARDPRADKFASESVLRKTIFFYLLSSVACLFAVEGRREKRRRAAATSGSRLETMN
jgi:hypothetical protein